MARFDHYKAAAALLYLANKAPQGRIDFYTLIKLMYLADKEYFHRRGRTITGDDFARMDHGSTGSNTYDLLKEAQDINTKLLALREFAKQCFLVTGERPHLFVTPLLQANMDELSPGETRVLDEIFREHGHKSFNELRELCHDAAWNSTPQEEDWWIKYEELAEGNAALIEYLRVRRDELEPGEHRVD